MSCRFSDNKMQWIFSGWHSTVFIFTLMTEAESSPETLADLNEQTSLLVREHFMVHVIYYFYLKGLVEK
jgi:hypothetical protein